MTEPVTHVIHIMPSLDALAKAFDLRLTPPFDDADTDAQVSVLSHVRAGYSSGDQLPINAGSSAEAGAALVLKCAVHEVSVASFETDQNFVGRDDMWSTSTGENVPRNPFVLFERENDWGLNLFQFHPHEFVPKLADQPSVESVIDSLKPHGGEQPIVVTWTEEQIEPSDDMTVLAREYALYLQSLTEDENAAEASHALPPEAPSVKASASAIYTSEPMVTRALAAEIRHAPEEFTMLLARSIGVSDLGGFQSVQCEASARLDLELIFAEPRPCSIGIEAKIDHELSPSQVEKQLAVVDHLVILLPSGDSAPSWLPEHDRVHVVTWPEALACFAGSRLTVHDIRSMPVPKSTVEVRFRAQRLVDQLPSGWRADVQRGDGGMPAIEIESPLLPNGRTLRGQIQTNGRGMPKNGVPILIEYSIGVSVPATEAEYPAPEHPHAEPGWVEPLRTLQREVISGQEDRLLVSTHKPGNGRSALGKRKLPLAKIHLADATWLAKGYTNGWALGIKSVKRPLDELNDVATTAVEIFTRWYEAEAARLDAHRTAT